MTNYILGTAGHIDHGKTALIKALTGFDCDTHPEEKKRGITINLGFTHLDLPDGSSIGIVDVPGHHDFVNTMVAGAHGIDILMLVVAADSGIMPQTIEHLQIAQSLGIKNGFAVITKTDLVDKESIEIIESEIREFLNNTFLNNCKIIKTSAVTGNGLDEIKNLLMELIENKKERDTSNIFRMYIDRIFSVAGFGTVVTGSALSGTVKKDDKIFLLPLNKETRVRRIEKHGEEVEFISAGNRVSLNLIGLNKAELNKGMILSGKLINATLMIDVKLNLFKEIKPIENWSDVIFLTGTFKDQSRMHLIDTDKAAAGESVLAQIHLTEHCTILKGDKFIIRSTSGLQTLGGGEVIDPYPLHHKRKTEKVITQLQKIAEGNAAEFIFSEVRKKRKPVSLKNILSEYFAPNDSNTKTLFTKLPEDITIIESGNDKILLLKKEKEKLIYSLLKNIESYHRNNPMIERGRSFDELVGIAGKHLVESAGDILKSILAELVNDKKIKQVQNSWALFNHYVKTDSKEEENKMFVEEFFKSSGMRTPLLSELKPIAKKKVIDEKKLQRIINLLVSEGKLTKTEKSYIHSEIISSCKKKLLKFLENQKEGITVAGFRDLINGNRKICLLMLSLFDSEGITERDGDVRKITDEGKKYLLENG